MLALSYSACAFSYAAFLFSYAASFALYALSMRASAAFHFVARPTSVSRWARSSASVLVSSAASASNCLMIVACRLSTADSSFF